LLLSGFWVTLREGSWLGAGSQQPLFGPLAPAEIAAPGSEEFIRLMNPYATKALILIRCFG
jgi:hypothetical protein